MARRSGLTVIFAVQLLSFGGHYTPRLYTPSGGFAEIAQIQKVAVSR